MPEEADKYTSFRTATGVKDNIIADDLARLGLK